MIDLLVFASDPFVCDEGSVTQGPRGKPLANAGRRFTRPRLATVWRHVAASLEGPEVQDKSRTKWSLSSGTGSLVQSFSWANQARSMSSPAQWSGAPCLRRPRKILDEQFMICHQNEKLLPCRVHVLVAKAASLWPVCQIICILRPACESSGTRNKKSHKPPVMNPKP